MISEYQESIDFKFTSTYIKNRDISDIRDIHLILSNNPILSNNDKLSLCYQQRQLFKKYILTIKERVEFK